MTFEANKKPKDLGWEILFVLQRFLFYVKKQKYFCSILNEYHCKKSMCNNLKDIII